MGSGGLGIVGAPIGEAGDQGGGELGDSGPELLEELFMFDSNGEMIDIEAGDHLPRTPANPPGARMPSDAGASARVRKEHEEGQRAGSEVSLQQSHSDTATFTPPNCPLAIFFKPVHYLLHLSTFAYLS